MNLKTNYIYSIEYETQGTYDCENHGCRDEGICRCYKIYNVEISKIDVLSITMDIYSQIYNTKSKQYKRDNKLNKILFGFDSDIEIYCIDRVLRNHKIYNTDLWEGNWSSGYYGDELDSITLNSGVFNKIIESLSTLTTLGTLKEKIEYVLNGEYGYLLDVLKNKKYRVEKVKTSDIVFAQTEYHKKIDKNLNFYDDSKYDLIRGVCLLNDDKYKVVDGYHRLTNTKKNDVKIIVAYD
jgi:hypothetical protein